MIDTECKGANEHDVAFVVGGRWPGTFVVVTEYRDWGIIGFIPIPDGEDVLPAWVRLETGNYEIIGRANIAVEKE